MGGGTGGEQSSNGGTAATGGNTSQTGAAPGDAGGTAQAGSADDAGVTAGTGGAGGMAGSAGSGAGGAPPCGGACKDKTAVCDTTTNHCVECTKASQCPTTKPACNASANQCVECVGSGDCTGNTHGTVCDTSHYACVACLNSGDCASKVATPVCLVATNACVECVANGDCTANAATPVCDTTTNACVQCLAPMDCKDPAAARCDGQRCKPCASNDDCSHVSGKGICDAGTCVECTAKDASACGMKDGTPLVCDSLKRACTTFEAHSAGLCEPCVTDAECVAGELCVLDTVGSGPSLKNVGYFCHWEQGDAANGAPSDCAATGTPYVKVVPNATSIDGDKADVCVLRVSSCPANADFSSKNCAPTGSPDDKVCGFSPPIDAKCAQFSATLYRCTMTCLSSDDCRNGSTCITAVNPPVCSL